MLGPGVWCKFGDGHIGTTIPLVSFVTLMLGLNVRLELVMAISDLHPSFISVAP